MRFGTRRGTHPTSASTNGRAAASTTTAATSTATATVAVLAGLAMVVGIVATGPRARASSHREAPLITQTPKVDATDFYMFTSYEAGREDFVTFVANYQPLQDPYGGPNYFTMDPEAVYTIMIDNDGDAVEDITFRFRFDNALRDLQIPVGDGDEMRMVSVPLANIGPIAAGDTGALNVLESYKVRVTFGDRETGDTQPITNAGTGEEIFAKPADNIGNKSIPDYAAYAAAHVYEIDLPGSTVPGRMFVGQRKDPFVVNLGETFDIFNLDPLGAENAKEDSLADKNVTSFVLELPKSFVTADDPIIGAWTASGLYRARVERPIEGRPFQYTQVSRLSSPLVNEVVIGLKDKDRFNASEPKDDGQFLDYVTNPTLPELLEILFGVEAPSLFPRSDLTAAFLTGFDGLNANGSVGEMLRLNTSIPPTPASSQSRLGLLGGDTAGFPNGRRLGDDVVDIELRVVMGALLPPELAPAGGLPFTDGAFLDASFFDATFPYLRDPLPGAPQ